MYDHTVPRPLVTIHVRSSELQRGHIGRGGCASFPHAPHCCTSSSPRAQPAQNGAEVSSSTSGRRNPLSIVQPSFVNRIADVGTPSPLVTRETSAPATCAVDVLRIWRTPSST